MQQTRAREMGEEIRGGCGDFVCIVMAVDSVWCGGGCWGYFWSKSAAGDICATSMGCFRRSSARGQPSASQDTEHDKQ